MHNYNVDIICSSRVDFKNILKKQKFVENFLPKNVNVYTYKHFRLGILSWPLGIISSLLKLIFLNFKTKYDSYICYSVLFTGIPAVLMSQILNINIVFRVIDKLHVLKKTQVQKFLTKN